MSWENKKRKKEEKREKCEDGERDREKYIERLREWRKGNKKKKGEDSDDLFVHDCILWELRTTPLFSTSQPSSPLCSVAELARPQLKPVSSCLSCGCLASWLAGLSLGLAMVWSGGNSNSSSSCRSWSVCHHFSIPCSTLDSPLAFPKNKTFSNCQEKSVDRRNEDEENKI